MSSQWKISRSLISGDIFWDQRNQEIFSWKIALLRNKNTYIPCQCTRLGVKDPFTWTLLVPSLFHVQTHWLQMLPYSWILSWTVSMFSMFHCTQEVHIPLSTANILGHLSSLIPNHMSPFFQSLFPQINLESYHKKYCEFTVNLLVCSNSEIWWFAWLR